MNINNIRPKKGEIEKERKRERDRDLNKNRKSETKQNEFYLTFG